jgi:mono/diheme cytochrome c family protein
MRTAPLLAVCALVTIVALACTAVLGDSAWGHGVSPQDAPAPAHALRNPYHENDLAIAAGGRLFVRYCAHCHAGRRAAGAPALDPARLGRLREGDLFWFLTNGNLMAGMPAWSRLPAAQRWQLVTYLRSGHAVGRP